MKKRILLYVGALAVAVLSALSIPMILRIIFCAVPILFFGSSTVLGYLSRLKKRSILNEYLVAIIATIAELVSGKFVYAAMTLLFFDAIQYFISCIERSAKNRIDGVSQITPKFAYTPKNGYLAKIPSSEIQIDQLIIVREGDIIPADGIVVKGTALIDYSNIQGPSDFVQIGISKQCISGSIVQSGELVIQCKKLPKDSYAASIDNYTKTAHKPSKKHLKTKKLSTLAQLIILVAAVLTFIISFIVTKSFSISVNYFAVLLVLSGTTPFLCSLSLLYHSIIINLRMHGIIIRDEHSVEIFSHVEAIANTNEIDSALRSSLEAEGIVISENMLEHKLAFLYRFKESLARTKNKCFKITLGFFDKKANATITDSNPARILDGFRIAKSFRSVLFENTACVIVEKILVLVLLFCINIHATDAMILEFGAAIICTLNASKYLN